MITPCRYTTQLPIHCIIHGKDGEINHCDDDDDKNQQNSNKKTGNIVKTVGDISDNTKLLSFKMQRQ